MSTWQLGVKHSITKRFTRQLRWEVRMPCLPRHRRVQPPSPLLSAQVAGVLERVSRNRWVEGSSWPKNVGDQPCDQGTRQGCGVAGERPCAHREVGLPAPLATGSRWHGDGTYRDNFPAVRSGMPPLSNDPPAGGSRGRAEVRSGAGAFGGCDSVPAAGPGGGRRACAGGAVCATGVRTPGVGGAQGRSVPDSGAMDRRRRCARRVAAACSGVNARTAPSLPGPRAGPPGPLGWGECRRTLGVRESERAHPGRLPVVDPFVTQESAAADRPSLSRGIPRREPNGRIRDP